MAEPVPSAVRTISCVGNSLVLELSWSAGVLALPMYIHVCTYWWELANTYMFLAIQCQQLIRWLLGDSGTDHTIANCYVLYVLPAWHLHAHMHTCPHIVTHAVTSGTVTRVHMSQETLSIIISSKEGKTQYVFNNTYHYKCIRKWFDFINDTELTPSLRYGIVQYHTSTCWLWD